MKIYFYYLIILSGLFIAGCAAAKNNYANRLPPYSPGSKAVYDSIVNTDSLFFDAYNTCKADVFEAYISDDIEFYHDRGGLTTSKKELMDALKNNICGKVRRELLKGSIEVYSIPNYGAVQIGAHRFYNNREADKGPSRYARFVHTWQRQNGQWKLARVISLH